MGERVERIDNITYSLEQEFYVMHHEAGITEIEGPFTERGAYDFADTCRENWTILRYYHSKEEQERVITKDQEHRDAISPSGGKNYNAGAVK